MAFTLTFPQGGALIAGGTGRVGAGVVESLARAGVPVLFTYRGGPGRDSERLAGELADRLNAEGWQVRSQRMDMRDPEQIEAALDALEQWVGRVHAVITTAGAAAAFSRLADFTPEQVDEFMAGDALSYFRLFRCGVQRLRRSGGGTITCTSTIDVGKLALNNGLSGMSKAAVESMIRHIAAEEAGAGIRANAVRICFVNNGTFAETEEWLAPPEPGREPQTWLEHASLVVRSHIDGIRLGRPCTTREAGDMFAWLASDQSSFLTGQSLALDGGEDL